MFAETRRFERGLNVHLEIRKIGNELRVCLRLVPSPHDSKCHARIALLGERRDDRVQGTFPSRKGVRRCGIEREKSAAVVQRKTRSRRHDARPKQLDRKSTRLNSSHGYISY